MAEMNYLFKMSLHEILGLDSNDIHMQSITISIMFDLCQISATVIQSYILIYANHS